MRFFRARSRKSSNLSEKVSASSLQDEVSDLKSELSRLQLQLASIQAASAGVDGQGVVRRKSNSTRGTAQLTSHIASTSSRGLESEFSSKLGTPPVSEICIPTAQPFKPKSRNRVSNNLLLVCSDGSTSSSRASDVKSQASRDIHVSSRQSWIKEYSSHSAANRTREKLFAVGSAQSNRSHLHKDTRFQPMNARSSSHNFPRKHQPIGAAAAAGGGQKRPPYSYRTVKQINTERSDGRDGVIATTANDRASIFRPKSSATHAHDFSTGERRSRIQSVSTNTSSLVPSSWDKADLDSRTAQAGWDKKAPFETKPRAEATIQGKHNAVPSWSGPLDSKQGQQTKSRGQPGKSQKAPFNKQTLVQNLKLRPSERQQRAKPAAKASVGLGHELLAAIKGGVQLKHVEQNKQEETQTNRQILATSPLLTRLQERKKKYLETSKGGCVH